MSQFINPFPDSLPLAKAFARVKSMKLVSLTDEQKARQKALTKARNEKRLAENLAQRALVQSKRR